MALMREHDQPGRAAVAADRVEQPLRLDRVGARVGVLRAVDEQQRRADLVGVPERRDPVIDRRRLPEAAPLGLETERGQRPVVGPAAGDAGREQVGVREQVGGHEAAVAVAGDNDPLRVDDPCLVQCPDVGPGGGGDLLQVGVVHGLRVADHRHGRVGQHRVPAQDEGDRSQRGQPGELADAPPDLAGRVGAAEVERVGPQQQRQPPVPGGVMAGREVEDPGQGHAVAAVVRDEVPGDRRQLRMRVGPGGQRPRAGAAERDGNQVRRLGGALVPDDDLGLAGVGEPKHMLNGSRRALVQTGGRQRGEIEAIEEGPVAVRSGPVAAQVDGGTVAQHRTGAVRAERQQRRAGVAVGVVHRQVEDHPGLVRLRQVQQPGGQPPPVAVMLGHQQLVRLVQVVPAQAAVACFGDCDRLAGERRAELEDPVAVVGGRYRVAAVQRLRPHQAGRRPLLPADQARAGRHALPRHLVAHRQVGEHGDRRPGGIPHLGPPGEQLPRDAEREGPLEPVHEQVGPVGGIVEALVQPGWRQRLALTGDRVDPAGHGRRQRLEAVLIGRGAQQVGVGGHLRVLAGGLIGLRLDRRFRQRQLPVRRGEHQQRPPVA